MSFMQRQITRETFVCVHTKHDGIRCAPRSLFPPEERDIDDPEEEVETIEGKWWCRLSAPGYMDCTEWDGPFDSSEECEAHLSEMYGDDEEPDDDEEPGTLYAVIDVAALVATDEERAFGPHTKRKHEDDR